MTRPNRRSPQALKELAAPAGFDITLDITEPGGYWDRWTEVASGHYVLDTSPVGDHGRIPGLYRGIHRRLE